ncbi:MAG: HEAT repeat domain-containing protein [Bacteroidota bacterium]
MQVSPMAAPGDPHEHPGFQIEELIDAFRSGEGAKRERARRAIVRLGRKAVPPLISCLSDVDDIVRWEAAKALKDIPNVSAAPALVNALADPVPGVRWLAAEALIALREQGLPHLLAGIVRHVDSVWFLESAHHILVVLGREHVLPRATEEVLHVLRDYTASREHLTWSAHRALIEEFGSLSDTLPK